MRWFRQNAMYGGQPRKGLSRDVDADSLIRRLLRASDPTARKSSVAPQVIAEKIGQKLIEHEKCPEDTVAGRIGTGFESGDRARLSVEHDDLRVEVTISVRDRGAADAFDFDDDGDLDLDDDDDFDFDDDEPVDDLNRDDR